MADVSILDISGSQWNFKDTEARSLIAETNTNLTTLTNNVNKLFYSQPANGCCAQFVIVVNANQTVEVDLLSLFPNKSPPRGAYVCIKGRLSKGSTGYDVNLESVNADKSWSISGANIGLSYFRNNRHLIAKSTNNAIGMFSLSVAFCWF